MDANKLMKKLDVSWVKVAWLAVFGPKGALYDYALDKANTALNALLYANSERVFAVREALGNLSRRLEGYAEYLPARWRPYAEDVNDALHDVYEITEDGVVTKDEAKAAIGKAVAAYSAWRADGVDVA